MKKLLLVSLLLGSFAFGHELHLLVEIMVLERENFLDFIKFVTLTAKNIMMWLLDILGEEAIM